MRNNPQPMNTISFFFFLFLVYGGSDPRSCTSVCLVLQNNLTCKSFQNGFMVSVCTLIPLTGYIAG